MKDKFENLIYTIAFIAVLAMLYELHNARKSLNQIEKLLIDSKVNQTISKVNLPSQETLNYFGEVYKLTTEEQRNVDLISHYEKDGRLHVIFEIPNGKICDMPMIQTKKGWSANGVSCR
ncbi:MAG TPA: hypothetical protein K8U92_02840 [Aliarcobacter thereius]|nr:hypothetical protein [Aliarcobacter thereius]HJE02788.1 hypothetical protein [Aliarcobacter thereius]